MNRTFIFAFLLILNSALSDWISFLFAKLYGVNYFVINTYFLLEIIFLFFFYKRVIKSKIPQIIYLILLLYFLLTITTLNFNFYLTRYFSIHALANIPICILFLYEIYHKEQNLLIERLPDFWFVIGLLFYFSGSMFTIVLSHEILNGPLPWSFTHLANILKNFLFAMGFIVALKK